MVLGVINIHVIDIGPLIPEYRDLNLFNNQLIVWGCVVLSAFLLREKSFDIRGCRCCIGLTFLYINILFSVLSETFTTISFPIL